jgi:hypothetical protein
VAASAALFPHSVAKEKADAQAHRGVCLVCFVAKKPD